MAVTIRRAEEKDIPFILGLLDYIRALHHKGRPDIFKDNGTKYDAVQLSAKIKDENEVIFVAYDGETPLGYICCIIKERVNDSIRLDKKVLYVDDFCVGKQFTKRGIGRMLMDKAKDYAKSIGCNGLELVVWKFDGSAEDVYRSYGFTTMSRRMEYKFDED